MNMRVSVVIPARNMAATLPDAIESALDAGASEVVIFNDASEDDTIRTVLRYVGSNVRLLNSPLSVRAGVCFARNFAIQHAQNELILPLDADDTLTDHCALESLTRGCEPGTFTYGDWTEDDHGNRKEPSPIGRLSEKNIVHATWMFHKDDWRRVGGYNPLFEPGCEDWAFMCALVEAGVQGVHKGVFVYHRNTGGNRSKVCHDRRELIWSLLRETYPKVFHAQPSHSI